MFSSFTSPNCFKIMLVVNHKWFYMAVSISLSLNTIPLLCFTVCSCMTCHSDIVSTVFKILAFQPQGPVFDPRL